jgi:uncharacterized protein (DUF169 family)
MMRNETCPVGNTATGWDASQEDNSTSKIYIELMIVERDVIAFVLKSG